MVSFKKLAKQNIAEYQRKELLRFSTVSPIETHECCLTVYIIKMLLGAI